MIAKGHAFADGNKRTGLVAMIDFLDINGIAPDELEGLYCMPQLVLEYSSNIIEKNGMNNLFQEYHFLLERMLPTDIDSCKSRSIPCSEYYIGNGQPDNAFIHISLKIMPGRELNTVKNIGEAMMVTTKNYFSESFKRLNLQITIEIMELQKTYFKITSL